MTSPLGPLLVLTDRMQSRRPLADTVRGALDGGARTVVLREKDLAPDERRRLADELAVMLDDVSGVLVLAGTSLRHAAGLARPVHLASSDGVPRDAPALRGRSCHDIDEVRAALAERSAYVTVSPVFPTRSKPGHGPALGLDGLADLVRAAADMPVYALAGIAPDAATSCVRAGAAGVAVMGAVMRDPQPQRLVERYLARLRTVSP